MTSEWRHNHRPGQNSRFSVKYRRKLKISLKKVINIGISRGYLLIKKGKGNSNILCKFQLHSMQIFFQNGRLKFSQVATTHPYPPSLSLPYPTGGTPNFLTSKWPQRMFRLPRWPWSLSFWFWAAGKNSRGGVVTTSSVRVLRRGLSADALWGY